MIPLLFLIVYIATSHGRLIERSTENPTIDFKTTSPNLPIRLARAAFDEDTLTTFSREYTGQSDEFQQYFNRRARHFVITSPKQTSVVNNLRFPRESSERINKSLSNNTTSSVTLVKEKDTLVKKPIAKFSEVDYDDDFQTRMIKSPTKFLDSGEHEDEDFNLDDYDFDTNHDEYAGRGKPLEPRTKIKEQHNKEHQEEQQIHLPELEIKPVPTIKIQSKLVIPRNDKIYSNKKVRSAIKKLIPRSAMDTIKEDDYNYDETTTAKIKEKEIKRHDGDDYGEENESKENERKSVRAARSALNMRTYMDKLGEKTSTIMSKVLSVLPMFPQLPRKKKEYSAHLGIN